MKFARTKKLLLGALITAVALQFSACGALPAQQSANGTENIQTTGTAQADENTQSAEGASQNDEAAKSTETFDIERAKTDDYKLKQVVILSRHNIRAPLSSNGSINEIATPHEWYHWTANSSELSLKGGVLETIMGQYFRKWLESEELIPENYIPAEGETRFYANSKQRTLATAQYFSSGMLPAANVDIEHYAEIGKMDNVFNPKLHFTSDSYEAAVNEQIGEMGGTDGMKGVAVNLEDNYKLLTDVIDYTDSEGYKSGELSDFKTDDTEIVLEFDKEPNMKGSLKTACQISDALVLQYYEEEDPLKAAFGKTLSLDQWKQLSEIKDVYGVVLQSAPLLAINMAHPLLEEIKNEVSNDARKFTFLCGHDVNITNVLSAMEVEDYELPYTIEGKTPIGAKVVFEKWTGNDGKDYGAVELVYQSTEQIRNRTMLDMNTPPVMFPLTFKDMEKNEDGLYLFEDIQKRLDKAIGEYYEIESKYTEGQSAAA